MKIYHMNVYMVHSLCSGSLTKHEDPVARSSISHHFPLFTWGLQPPISDLCLFPSLHHPLPFLLPSKRDRQVHVSGVNIFCVDGLGGWGGGVFPMVVMVSVTEKKSMGIYYQIHYMVPQVIVTILTQAIYYSQNKHLWQMLHEIGSH